jgi:hypothetical protein
MVAEIVAAPTARDEFGTAAGTQPVTSSTVETKADDRTKNDRPLCTVTPRQSAKSLVTVFGAIK